ncbi:MAG: nicotinamide mononucleotide transporter family protein [Anaerolineae bacterium]
MSYVELLGTILYLWSVWLIAHRRVLTWPVGIISVLLYMALFYQIRLYADALEQIYYLIQYLRQSLTSRTRLWLVNSAESGNLVEEKLK